MTNEKLTMSNEEAIEVLKNDIEICTIQQKQACDMAIKALEQQPCEDCISREQAIAVVRKWFDKMQLNGDICLDGIISLPSVTPQQKVGKWIDMSEGFTPYECSKCAGVEFKKSNYCPNCGAKMEVEE